MVHGDYACTGRAHYADYWKVDEMSHKHNRRKWKRYLLYKKDIHITNYCHRAMLDSMTCTYKASCALCFASCVLSEFEASTSEYSLVEALLTTQLDSGNQRKRTMTQARRPNLWPML